MKSVTLISADPCYSYRADKAHQETEIIAMSRLRQLSREDIMFIAGETDSIYQHVGILVTLDTADCAEFDFAHFRDHCSERLGMIPQYRWKLHSIPLGLDRPYWVEDEHFSFDHHIKHIALPSPGDPETLCEVAANLYCNRLDRSKPLWEIWLIEGLEGGKFAYLQKFHHCMMDGEGALKMTGYLCDFEPHPSEPKVIDESVSSASAGETPSYQEQSVRAWQHMLQMPGEAARSAFDFLRPKILEQFVWPPKPREQRPVVPTARFNGVISSERGFTFASLPLNDMKLIKNQFEVSLNDVVLALVSGAMRKYLKKNSELPHEPLRTNIPVSLRTADDDQMGNKVTNTTVTLATDLNDPLDRLKEINRESEQAKARAHSGAPGMIEIFQIMPPILLSSMMESLPAEQAPQILGANLIVSNVRGAPMPMYISGARLESMYPLSILTAGMGINFTCVSYCDTMDFGIIVDPELVPSHTELATGLQEALAEYMTLRKAQKTPHKRKPAPARAKKKSVKRPAGKSSAGKKPAR